MASRINPDVLQALQDWKAGKPVKTLELGHVHRMKDVPGFSPAIDTSEHLHRDQERAHAYCFSIIEWWSKRDAPPQDHDAFMAERYLWANFPDDTTAEEIDAAESLAWKALRFGWVRAIDGHKDSMYITVTNPGVAERSNV